MQMGMRRQEWQLQVLHRTRLVRAGPSLEEIEHVGNVTWSAIIYGMRVGGTVMSVVAISI